jgi:hypothetical protein
VRLHTSVEICAQALGNFDSILCNSAANMLRPIAKQSIATSFPSLPIDSAQIDRSRCKYVTLSFAQVGGESIIGAIEWLAALVVAARAHRPLELDEIAIRTLYRF